MLVRVATLKIFGPHDPSGGTCPPLTLIVEAPDAIREERVGDLLSYTHAYPQVTVPSFRANK